MQYQAQRHCRMSIGDEPERGIFIIRVLTVRIASLSKSTTEMPARISCMTSCQAVNKGRRLLASHDSGFIPTPGAVNDSLADEMSVAPIPLEAHGEPERHAVHVVSKDVSHESTRAGDDDRILAAVELESNAQ